MAKLHTEKVLLVGEGIHHHALLGKFEMDNDKDVKTFAPIKVLENSLLHHRKPNGTWSNEHKTLPIKKGNWVMGMQIEWNPFSQQVSRVWD